MKTDVGSFLATGSYCFMSALFAVVVVDLILYEVMADTGFHQGASIPLGTALLSILWLQVKRPHLKRQAIGRLVLAISMVSAALVAVFFADLEMLWARLVSAGLAGGIAFLIYWFVQHLVTRFPDLGTAVFAGPIAIGVGLINLPRLLRGSDAPRWVLIGIGVSITVLLVIVLDDGLRGDRGRLRGPGFVSLGIGCMFGIVGLVA